MNDQSNPSRQGRIPATLQAVFLASNRGRDVNKPPPAKVASKVFFRNWLFQRQAGSKEKRGSLFAGSTGKKTKRDKKPKVQLKKENQVKAVHIPKANVSAAFSRHLKLLKP
jgi:hypothetical protein